MKYLLSIIVLFSFYYVVPAQLSPGDLSRPHAQLEGLKNCTECHALGKKVTAEKCLACHKILKERIDSNQGLHANPDYQTCQKCHVEHQGRDFDLIWWENGKEKFDHRKTGYLLEGKHQSLKCDECHRPQNMQNQAALTDQKKDLQRTFLGLTERCLSCHRDEHRGQFTDDCLNCHTMQGWKPAARFDHAQSRFPLTGRHQKVDCEKCHPPVTDHRFTADSSYVRFTGLSYQNCTACHEDVHRNRFGPNCESCHSTAGWTQYNRQKFDHSTTRYPLRGKHRNVACEGCHKPGEPLTGVAFQQCGDCHRNYHQGQFSAAYARKACDECHSVEGFSPAQFTIQQHDRTDFQLEGAHLAIPCIACHEKIHNRDGSETVRFQFGTNTCSECHRDVHKGIAGKYLTASGCQACHTASGWREMDYDHSKTDFPLEGRHRSATCRKCHLPEDSPYAPERLKFAGISSRCEDCHQDAHLGQFAQQTSGEPDVTRCSRCHTPKDWLAEKFDHNRDAAFKLEGAHRYVKCSGCHPDFEKRGKRYTRFKPLDSACSSCHKNIQSEKEKEG